MKNNIELIKLNNGLTLIMDSQPWYTSVSVVAYIGIGAKHEEDSLAGISHLLEHLVFKGTKSFPTSRDISHQIESIGGRLDAFTAYDYSGFFAKVPRSQVETALKVILELIYNPLLRQEDMVREKEIIYDELRLRRDSPEDLSDLLLVETLWKKGYLSKDLGGTPESISLITLDDLRQFHSDYYKTPNLTLIISGSFPKEEIIHKLESLPSQSFTPPIKDFTCEPSVPSRKTIEKDTSEAYLRIGYPLFGRDSSLRYTAFVFNVLLGGGGGSRLFEEIREKRSLAYDVQSSIVLFKEAGELIISLNTHPQKVEEALEITLQEVANLKEGKVTKEEIKRGKEYLKGSLLISLEDTLRRAFYWGEGYLLDGKLKDIEETVNKIEKVDFLKELQQLKPYLDSDKNCIIQVLPKS